MSSPNDETQYFDNLKQSTSNTRTLPVEEKPFIPTRPSTPLPDEHTFKFPFPHQPFKVRPSEQAQSNLQDESSPDSAETVKTHDLSVDFSLRTTFQTFHKNVLLETVEHDTQLEGPSVNFIVLQKAVKSVFQKEHESSSWELSEPGKMAMPIRDVTKLIPEYNGKESSLDSFIKKIDKLWNYIAEFEENDRTQFLLVLQLKLIEKAAEAVQDNDFDTWEAVKTDLIEHITPHRNTEKSELKLCAIKQLFKEDVETYAKRIEDALDTLNRSFAQEDQNDTIKRENDRKARKAFENGLVDSNLRNKAIARGSNTLKEAVDYIIEQELRYSELKPAQSMSFCSYCKKPGHVFAECRARRAMNESRGSRSNQSPPRENNVLCYKCNQKGHYANACPAQNNPNHPRYSNPNNPRYPPPDNQNRRDTRHIQNHPSRQEHGNDQTNDRTEIENVTSKN